jgi:hypothetical protein
MPQFGVLFLSKATAFARPRAEHGFGGGYTVVKHYIWIAWLRGCETFVPLSHTPGHAVPSSMIVPVPS